MGWIKGAIVTTFLIAAGALAADGKGLINLHDMGATVWSMGDYAQKVRSLGPHRITEADRAAVVAPFCTTAFSKASQAVQAKCLDVFSRTRNGVHLSANDYPVMHMACEPASGSRGEAVHQAAMDCYSSRAWGNLDTEVSKIVRRAINEHGVMKNISAQIAGVDKKNDALIKKLEETKAAENGQRTDRRAVDIKNRLPGF